MDGTHNPTRREVVIGSAAAASLPALGMQLTPVLAAEGQATVTGFVFEDAAGTGARGQGTQGVAGVLVSNGKDVAKTDADGRYTLPLEEECVIFVIKPTGYAVP